MTLLANAFNALAIGVAGAAVIIPGIASPTILLDLQRIVWFVIAAGLHSAGQIVLGFMRSED